MKDINENKNNVICIIGMHRSGTSMVARVLNLCGLDLGPSEQFIPPNKTNPMGHFENEVFVKIDDALLAHFGGSWDNPPLLKEGCGYDPSLEQIVHEARSLLGTFSKSSQWGWKDPRTTVLLPFWKSLIPDLQFVICIRSPLEVAKSLAKRDGIPIQKGVYLWNQYMRAAIRDTEGYPRIFTFYEDFFKDAHSEIKRVVEFSGLQIPDDLSSLYDVISPELKHHTSETLELLKEDELITEYKLFYIGLRALTTEGFVRSTSDHTPEAFISENISKFFNLLEQFHDEHEMAQLQSELADKEQQINRLYAMVHQQQQAQSKKEEQLAQEATQLQATVQAQQQVLGDKEQQVVQLTAERARLDQTVQAQQQVLGDKEQQVVQLTAERARLDQTVHDQHQVLNTIYASLGWKIVRRIWKLTDILLPIGTKRRVFAKLIYRLPSLLTRRNLGSIVKHIRLFGLTATYKEVNKNLCSGTYVSKVAINTIPVINIEVLEEEAVPDEEATISFVIPVKNAGDDFRCLLSMIKNQKGFKDIEIIVVDSGSTDKSLEIARECGAKIIEISPDEFSHSYARNLGAEYASGDYLLFTVQDALPPSNLWLHELFSVIKGNDVVAVSCAEYPREDSDLFYRVISWNHYRFLEVDKQDRILCKPDDENHLTLRKNGQLSDIACLISKDTFLKYKYRGNYAEDLDLGLRLIRDGYRLAFLSSTRIIHSHNRPAYYYLKRGYVDNLSLPRIFPGYPVSTIEAERMFRDIIFTYEVVNSMVNKELHRVTVPCRVRELSSIVTEKLSTAVQDRYPHDIKVVSNGFVDSKFTSFLQDVSKQNYLNGGRNSRYDGILVEAIQSFTIMMFGYMEDTYELIDDYILEQFKSSFYKSYALMCGAHLAHCFFQGSESTKEKLKEINNELTKEV